MADDQPATTPAARVFNRPLTLGQATFMVVVYAIGDQHWPLVWTWMALTAVGIAYAVLTMERPRAK